MRLPSTFNSNQVELSADDRDFSVLPLDTYTFQIVTAEVKSSKNNPDNTMLAMTVEVKGGAFNGRKAFVNYNLWHTSEKAVEIANREFSNLLNAIGLANTPIQDTNQIGGKVFLGKYGPQKNNPDFGQLYSVKAVTPVNLTMGAPVKTSSPAGSPPWATK